MYFQEIIAKLENFWRKQGCLVLPPYDHEVGAGTLSPYTFLKVLDKKPWKVVYVQPSRRPTDGRYGENPNRLYLHHQLQVIIKPPLDNIQDLYLKSLQTLDIKNSEHDIRFVEDNWETPVLGAQGVGWEVWLDGLEITQFTYFQQAGGYELNPISCEITYGLERIAMFIQKKDNVFDIDYNETIKYKDIRKREEKEDCVYAFEKSDTDSLIMLFDIYEKEAIRLLEEKLLIPAYNYLLKCSHTFNLLDAKGVVSVIQRMNFLGRMRQIAYGCAKLVVEEDNE